MMTCKVDGILGRDGIQYIGIAHRQFDGTWRALAIMPHGALCVVECSIVFGMPTDAAGFAATPPPAAPRS